MKLILYILLVPKLLFAQSDTLRNNNAGKYLVRYGNQMQTGLLFQAAGVGVSLGSAATGVKSSAPYIVSGGLYIIGFVMTLTAQNKVKQAGIYLEGNKLVLPLNRKKRNK